MLALTNLLSTHLLPVQRPRSPPQERSGDTPDAKRLHAAPAAQKRPPPAALQQERQPDDRRASRPLAPHTAPADAARRSSSPRAHRKSPTQSPAAAQPSHEAPRAVPPKVPAQTPPQRSRLAQPSKTPRPPPTLPQQQRPREPTQPRRQPQRPEQTSQPAQQPPQTPVPAPIVDHPEAAGLFGSFGAFFPPEHPDARAAAPVTLAAQRTAQAEASRSAAHARAGPGRAAARPVHPGPAHTGINRPGGAAEAGVREGADEAASSYAALEAAEVPAPAEADAQRALRMQGLPSREQSAAGPSKPSALPSRRYSLIQYSPRPSSRKRSADSRRDSAGAPAAAAPEAAPEAAPPGKRALASGSGQKQPANAPKLVSLEASVRALGPEATGLGESGVANNNGSGAGGGGNDRRLRSGSLPPEDRPRGRRIVEVSVAGLLPAAAFLRNT